MRAALALLVALVALAGCGVLPGGSSTATQSPTPSPQPIPSYPPGVDAGGVTDPDALLVAHRVALLEAGFVVSTRTTLRTASEETNVSIAHRVAVEPGGDAHAHAETRTFDGGRRVTFVRWTDGSTAARRVGVNGTTTSYAPYDGDADADELVRTGRLRWFLERASFEVTAVVLDGERARYLLTVEGFADGGNDSADGGAVRLTGRLSVTDDGRITAFRASLVTAGPHRRAAPERLEVYEYRLVDAGAVDVDRPPWVDGGRED